MARLATSNLKVIICQCPGNYTHTHKNTQDKKKIYYSFYLFPEYKNGENNLTLHNHTVVMLRVELLLRDNQDGLHGPFP